MGAPKKLSPDQLGIVLSAIEDTSSSLSTVSGRLWDTKTGLPRSARFGTGTTLTAVLQDNLLPSPAQRLVAIFLLYDLIVTEYVIFVCIHFTYCSVLCCVVVLVYYFFFVLFIHMGFDSTNGKFVNLWARLFHFRLPSNEISPGKRHQVDRVTFHCYP